MSVKLLLSAFADECTAGFDGQLAALNRLGINRLEIRGVDGKNISVLTPDEVKTAADKLRAAGVTVSAVGSPLGKIAADGDIAGHMETARQVFETANRLGTRLVRVFSFYPGELSGEAFREAALSHLDRMLTLADEAGITLCHENESGILGESPEACRALLDAFGGRLKCVFDMGNFVLCGHDPLSAYRLLRPDTVYFHIKDARRDGAIVPPGCGDARIAEILSDYAAIYTAVTDRPVPVTLEPHLHAFVGLSSLTDRKLSVPFAYPDGEAAMKDAASRLRGMFI